MLSPERYASTTLDRFDYVVVGAGSAGCVLANRLSADPSYRVLLLEAGADAEPFWVRTPAGLPFLFRNSDVNWRFSTEPEVNLNSRKIYWPRGKIVGGSSAINGMLHAHGNPQDYDDWSAAGNDARQRSMSVSGTICGSRGRRFSVPWLASYRSIPKRKLCSWRTTRITAAGIWTRDLGRAHRVAAGLEAGQIYVNEYLAGGVETPLGGYKLSGYGREKGLEALHHYTQLKCITIRL